MTKARFDRAFAVYIRAGEEKISPRTFFHTLAEIEQERVEKTIELQASIVGGRLQFAPSPDVSVNGNEIVLGTQRIVVKVS